MRVAVDVHGGDHAPQAVIDGVCQALNTLDGAIEVVLVGDTAHIEKHMARWEPFVYRHRVRIEHTTEVIDAHEEPVRAVQTKKRSSLVMAAKLVRDGAVDAMVTAGNTGAFLVAGTLVVGRIKGIERAALAPTFPTMDGRGVLVLDVGANMDATARQLVQYAHMGARYRQGVHRIGTPRIGLLNVGTEPSKGNALTKEVYALLQDSPLHFVGNVEARDVLQGVCDVLVCDGFSGNILLKALEGAVSLMFRSIKAELQSSLLTSIAGAIVRPRMRALRQRFDEKQVALAPLLGVRGVLLKCHGSSDAATLHNAFVQVKTMVDADIGGSFTGIA
ncbi:MAG: phosphate acyltransferase PlsX [Paenibacillaceae bacterium]|nr:phosphate acyltransferase PlsX [Paenibacillaceae bacterium]